MKVPQGEVTEVVSPSEQPRVFYYEMVENAVVIGRDRSQVSSGRGITIPPEERGQFEVSEGSRLFIFNANKDAEINIQPLPGLIPSSEFDVTPFGSPNIFRQDIQTVNGVTQSAADWTSLFKKIANGTNVWNQHIRGNIPDVLSSENAVVFSEVPNEDTESVHEILELLNFWVDIPAPSNSDNATTGTHSVYIGSNNNQYAQLIATANYDNPITIGNGKIIDADVKGGTSTPDGPVKINDCNVETSYVEDAGEVLEDFGNLSATYINNTDVTITSNAAYNVIVKHKQTLDEEIWE